MSVTDGRRDSGLDSERIERGFKRKGVKIALIAAACILVVAFVLALAMMYRDQEKKLDELIAQRQQLEDRLDELAREKERLESKLEYTNSLEGLLQYARDNLGYVFPDDTRYEDDGN